MFLLEDKKIQTIFKNHLGYSDEMIVDLLKDYADCIQSLFIDTVLSYIEEKALKEELDYIEKLSDLDVEEKSKYNNLYVLYKYLLELPIKYPDLQTIITKKISKYNRAIYSSIKDTLPDAALAEILEIAAQDINDIRKLAKQYQIPL